MKEMRETASVLENFYNNLAITNVISRDDVISLEDSLGSNVITATKDIKTFSVSKTFLNVTDVKELIKEEIRKHKVASTITQEQLYDKSDKITTELTYSNLAELIAGKDIKEGNREKLLKFLKDDRYFLRYELNGDIEELINIKSKGIFEVMISYPEVVEELAKQYVNQDKILNTAASIITNLGKKINNGENVLDIDVSKLNFVSDSILSNLITKDNPSPLSLVEKHTTSYFMDVNKVIELIENLGYGEEKLNVLGEFIHHIGEYDNRRTQEDINSLSDFLDTIKNHMDNPHFCALYSLITCLLVTE